MKNNLRITYIIILISVITESNVFPQSYDYWKNAPTEGTRIYLIYFATEHYGFAVSAKNELFISTDAGNTWDLKETNKDISIPVSGDFLWSAEIYCSAMQIKDGGNSWVPYSAQMQEHFCRVYLKDPNVDYKTASEFLNTVTSKILSGIINNNIDSSADKPQQCTEYYSNEKEGWALGWCLKNFKMSKSPDGIK